MKPKLFALLAVALFGAVSAADGAPVAFEYVISSNTYITPPASSLSTYAIPPGIHFPGSTNTNSSGANALGDVVGVYYMGSCVGCGPEHGFRYSSGIYTTVDVPDAYWGTEVAPVV